VKRLLPQEDRENGKRTMESHFKEERSRAQKREETTKAIVHSNIRGELFYCNILAWISV